MLTFILTAQNRIIRANSLEEFADKYRAGSFRPEATMAEFMQACTTRAAKFHIHLDPTTPESFVLSLMKADIIRLDKQNLS